MRFKPLSGLLLTIGFGHFAIAQPPGQMTSGPGYTVFQPHGWALSADPVAGGVTLREPGGGWAMLSPYHVSGGPLGEAGARQLLERTTAGLLPQAPWQAAQSAGPSLLRRVASDAQGTCVALMNGVSDAQGTAGTLAITYAPAATAGALQPAFAQIISSFRPSGLTRYTRWTDPAEGAFTVDVPEGYSVRGGVIRNLAGTYVRVELTAPDSGVYVMTSNEYPAFAEPNPYLAMQGIHDGGQVQTYLPGVSTPVRQYLPGAQFIGGWLLPQLAGPGQFQITAVRDRSDLPFVQQINQFWTSSNSQMNAILGAGMRVDSQCNAGEADYLVRRGGVEMQGTALAITQRQAVLSQDLLLGGTSTSAYWSVYTTVLAEAVPSRFAEASTHMARLIDSFAYNSQWLSSEMRAQAQGAAERSRLISQTNDEIRQMMNDTFAERSASQDRQHEEFGRLIRGVEIVGDPTTGQTYEVEAGAGYYWLNRDGTYGTSDTWLDLDPVNTQELLRPEHMPQ